MADATPDFTPVKLLTGFLGSGKTTLLQRLLADPALSDTAVLINEFGEVGLDHHLIEHIDETVVLLQSGCLCCTIRGELSTAIRDLHSRGERGSCRRSGAWLSRAPASPIRSRSCRRCGPIRCCGIIFVPAIVTTIDAVNGASQLDRIPKVRQLAVADRLVLTKTDLRTRSPSRVFSPR